jgi:starch synthase
VRETGGLKDSVAEFDPKTGEGTGFTFAEYDAGKFFAAIKKAINAYNNRELWEGLVRKVMKLDFSWEKSAGDYIGLYEKILEK